MSPFIYKHLYIFSNFGTFSGNQGQSLEVVGIKGNFSKNKM